ncbi:GDSL-type esterase/lipase family protein [Gracilibacillus kekensis]|uniref:Lysophospholipase L1 n=1 Tax=Gracilibacillus kekensis TaxID=1027249 RepID=A0A1M7KH25_9BACI|nr:GDSL-type esterase/lipase family protein [Gracilibacillus kekensis]SHM64598.1 Lysophospholipase L1 [Gracilibacillus kekensis]
MHKKTYIVLLIIVLAILSVVFLTFIQSDPPPDIVDQPDEQSSEEISEEDLTEESGDEEQNSISQNIQDGVKEVIDALNFFKKDTHIVAIGDSLTQGVGDETNNQGYVGILEDRLNEQDYDVTFDNFGKRGNRTDHLLKRLKDDPEITESLEEADMVLITIGANDIMQIMKDNFMNLTEEPFMKEREPYGDRLSEIFEYILSVNEETDIYLLGFFNPFEKYFGDIKALEQILTRWSNTSLEVTNQYEQVNYIPMQDIYQNETENVFAEDHFHPNSKGYELIAERVITYLENEIQEAQN